MINIQQNMPLSEYTTFCIGGPARFFAEVSSEEELKEALDYAKDNSLEFFVLGGGSNLLVSDKGFDGLVVKNKITSYELSASVDGRRVTSYGADIEVGAGVLLIKVVNDSVNNNLTGLEWAAGIPGTVGGAVRGNAGAFGGSISDVVESVSVLNIEKSQAANYKLSDCDFGYRNSVFKRNKNLIILSATFKLRKGNREESRKKIQEIVNQRIAKQPQDLPSAGSFFVNPVVENERLRKEFELEKGIKCKDKKIPAGWLIDKLDLRGKKMGGAMVSEAHPNFIVNVGQATAQDVIMLASFVKQQVRAKLGVQLQEEVQYVGF